MPGLLILLVFGGFFQPSSADSERCSASPGFKKMDLFEDKYNCKEGKSRQRFLVLSPHDKYIAKELLTNIEGRVDVKNTQGKIHGYPLVFSGLAKCVKEQNRKCDCVTFFELPHMHDNEDMLISAMDLSKKCFHRILLYLNFDNFKQTMSSESFSSIVSFISLLESSYKHSDKMFESFVVVVSHEPSMDLTQGGRLKSFTEELLKHLPMIPRTSVIPQAKGQPKGQNFVQRAPNTGLDWVSCELTKKNVYWMGHPNQQVISPGTPNVLVQCLSSEPNVNLFKMTEDYYEYEAKENVEEIDLIYSSKSKRIDDFFITTFEVSNQGLNGLRIACSGPSGSSENSVKIQEKDSHWGSWSSWTTCQAVNEKSTRIRVLLGEPGRTEDQLKYCKCSDLEELPHPRFVILGKTGVGKSSLANQLLGGRAYFKVGHGSESQTTEISWRADHYLGIGKCVTVIDTPGIKDSQGRDYEHTLAMQRTLRDVVKSVDVFVMIFKGDDTRFDASTLELLQWYEVIFGKDMWRHVVTETSFWSHRKEDCEKRFRERDELDEIKRQDMWITQFRQKLNVTTALIPSFYIDPVVDVFEDPMNRKYKRPTKREYEKFAKYTEELLEKTQDLPEFNCVDRCKAPASFYSGIPMLIHPENVMYFNFGKLEERANWQIFLGSLSKAEMNDFSVVINGKGSQVNGNTDGLQFRMTEERIGQKLATITLTFSDVTTKPVTEDLQWEVSLKNSKGASEKFVVKPVIDPTISEWSEWSTCSKSCYDETIKEHGKRTRSRTCSEGINSQTKCDESVELIDSKICTGEGDIFIFCPINFSWGSWSQWGNCYPKCGQGSSRTRQRHCNPALHGGIECPKTFDIEKEPCEVPVCPVNCQVGPWTEWSQCSATCNSEGNLPMKTRTRKILQESNDQGISCDAFETSQEVLCRNVKSCPVDGKLTDWAEWTACTKSCSSGVKIRQRSCIQPTNGGKDCEGELTEQEYCNTDPCPCEQGPWGEWTICEGSCDTGSRKRLRTLLNCETETEEQDETCLLQQCDYLAFESIKVGLSDETYGGTDDTTRMYFSNGQNFCWSSEMDRDGNDWATGTTVTWGREYFSDCNSVFNLEVHRLPPLLWFKVKVWGDDINVNLVHVTLKHKNYDGHKVTYKGHNFGWTENDGSGNFLSNEVKLSQIGVICGCPNIQVSLKTNRRQWENSNGSYTLITDPAELSWTFQYTNEDNKHFYIYKHNDGNVIFGKRVNKKGQQGAVLVNPGLCPDSIKLGQWRVPGGRYHFTLLEALCV